MLFPTFKKYGFFGEIVEGGGAGGMVSILSYFILRLCYFQHLKKKKKVFCEILKSALHLVVKWEVVSPK